ncbi:Tol biopolymer transport system component [Paenibacillus sp. SORGH_AS306]|uniref:WD40 repeat domain-containing protein n=1 Tax=unclassified Paenibacillus TaxID=185978 RepID=UPI0027841477|nr:MULTISPECIES: WD40 repeat domain-containing protein [unclassified Paenibacillus]MDQ1234568.1 Tol biopolymer transport system component [Paenibacillus sp. SORGH_AS_0306]MDR6111614.1 Tol biopolymer transport system component [Paenibacillus sp. SORGH_AS_0338]
MNKIMLFCRFYRLYRLSIGIGCILLLSACSTLTNTGGLRSSEPQLTVLPLDTSMQKQADEVMLTSVAPLKNVYGRTWLSDTKLIINKKDRLYMYHLENGKENALTPGRTSPQYLALTSQDGQHVFFTEGVDGDPYQILGYIWDVSTGNVTSIGQLDITSTVSWADNKHLITTKVGGGMRLIDLNGHSSDVVLPDAVQQQDSLDSVQKVGKIIYYLSPDTNVYRLVQYANQSEPTITPIANDVRAFSVSPDGQRIAIEQRVWNTTEPAKLIMIDTEGHVEGTLGQGSLISRSVWSPDSRMLAFSIHQVNQQGMNGLYIFDQHTGKTTPVFAKIQDANTSMQWNPSGDHLSLYDESRGVMTYIIGIEK